MSNNKLFLPSTYFITYIFYIYLSSYKYLNYFIFLYEYERISLFRETNYELFLAYL